MNDDLGRKIRQIAELLGQDNVPDNVKELAALIANSIAQKNDSADAGVKPADAPRAEAESHSVPDSKHIGADSPDMPTENVRANSSELINAANDAPAGINAVNDPRINLLNAIKPFMNSRRQKKISSCIQLLRVASLSRMLNEQNSNRQ